jgi:hypothetical protein
MTETETKAVIQEMLGEMMTNYPGTSWGDDNFLAFRQGLQEYPTWAVARAITSWVATQQAPPKSLQIFARTVIDLVSKTDTRGGCQMCDGESGWVEQAGHADAVHPCPTCRAEKFREWKAGDLTGRVDNQRFRPSKPNPEVVSSLRDRLGEMGWEKD